MWVSLPCRAESPLIFIRLSLGTLLVHPDKPERSTVYRTCTCLYLRALISSRPTVGVD